MDNGMQFEQHEMVVTKEYENGAREFFCPTCGRRFIIQWPPAYKRIVLDPGDESALHTGGTNGLVMMNPTVAQTEDDQPVDITGELDDPYLSLWSQYIDDNIQL